MKAVDVVVVGGGPAGSTAAILLARAGKAVVLIDKATFPRDKCCGDGLTTAALRRLDKLGLDPADVSSWTKVSDTSWRSPSGYSIDLAVPDDDEGLRVATARRKDLDAALLNMAKAEGVDVREGHALANVDKTELGLRITTSAEARFECRYVIGADGMWSALRRKVIPDRTPYFGEIHAFRQYMTNVTGPARDRLWVSFERDLLPGYLWSFPMGHSVVNIGIGVLRRPGESIHWMKSAWPEILARPHVQEMLGLNATAESPHKSWPIPARIDSKLLSAHDGRVLFVGDAARVVDPLTGEGIGQAMETAELAVEAILSAGVDDPGRAERQYKRRINTGMAFDNAFARSLARLVSHERPARAVIRMAPLGPWRGRYAIKWALEDNPRAGLLTPWRWRERFSKKHEAYR